MNRAVLQCGWKNCPEPVRRQVLAFAGGLSKTLGPNRVGIYLHGSLAMGCFNLRASDIDLLVVTERRLGKAKHQLASIALEASSKPCPIEVTTFSRKDLRPWRYPTPFDFHFSEYWRAAYEAGTAFKSIGKSGEDPAAHIVVTRARGVVLHGEPAKVALPLVPYDDYLDAILGDIPWAMRKLWGDPVMEGRTQVSTYLVLNTCRVLAFVRTRQILSKAEGGAWGLRSAPKKFAPLIRRALRAYAIGSQDGGTHFSEVRSFVAWATGNIRSTKW
jgi:predicted nucleotidyltransferase